MDYRHEGITTARRRFDLRSVYKAAGLGVAGFGLSLLLAGGALAAPPTTPSAATPAVATPSTPGASSTPVAPAPSDQPMPPAGGPRGDGTVTAVSGGAITVQAGGTSKVITVTGDTTYFVGGPDKLQSGSLASVQVGSRLHAEGVSDSNGAFTAIVVRVEAPQAGGEVTAVSGTTITVQDKGPASDGATKTLTVSGSTTYTVGGPESATAGSLADVQVGTHIHAAGTLQGDGSFSATAVRIDQPPAATGTPPTPPTPGKGDPHGGGEVTAVNGSTITVQDHGPAGNGGTQTIAVTGSTVYLVGGPGNVTKGSLADVQAGVHVHAEGTTDANGVLTAAIVRIDQPPAQP